MATSVICHLSSSHFSAEPSPLQNCHTVIFKAFLALFYHILNFFYFNKVWVKVPVDGLVIVGKQILHSYHFGHSCVVLNMDDLLMKVLQNDN